MKTCRDPGLSYMKNVKVPVHILSGTRLGGRARLAHNNIYMACFIDGWFLTRYIVSLMKLYLAIRPNQFHIITIAVSIAQDSLGNVTNFLSVTMGTRVQAGYRRLNYGHSQVLYQYPAILHLN